MSSVGNQPQQTTADNNSNTVTAKQYKTKEGHLVFSSVLTLPDGNIWYSTRPGDSFVVTKEAFDNILKSRQGLPADQQEDVKIEKPHALLTLEQQSEQQKTAQAAEGQQEQPQATT
jgi:hypothetical protein